MSKLTQEQYEQLPDFLKGDYVEQDGGYVHGGFAKVKATADELDRKAKAKDAELDKFRSELDEFKKGEQDRIDQARKEALETARTKGDVDTIEKRYQQQMEDLRKTTEAETRKAVLAEVAQERAKERSKSLAAQIGAELGVDSPSGEVIAMLIASRIEIDPSTGAEVFHDENGSAISGDKAGFIDRIKKEARFARLIKADVTTKGGGSANGSGSGSAAKKSFGEMTGSELSALLKANPAEYNRLKSEFYGT